MKNFGTLFGYEMKKLCKQPLTWVTAVLLTALSVFVAQGGLQPNFGHYFYSQSTGELIEFVAEADWSARMQEGGLALNGQVMDDAFFQTMKERVPDIEDYDEREQYFYYKDSTYRHAYSMTDFNNGDPRDNTPDGGRFWSSGGKTTDCPRRKRTTGGPWMSRFQSRLSMNILGGEPNQMGYPPRCTQ